ncbi:hypothetical protein EX30DRAFT_399144 [Ascodesmis nigricans]|uniref:Fatty acid hydroxylase domain-containing protein n=1 Tax=Ascodesmis nigricans TaxID=341454 RepID=A0A4S2MQ46_9PEZI|nr:hypothetical protein EX30DRAFT_399144 [Ascodesmis nigricans]
MNSTTPTTAAPLLSDLHALSTAKLQSFWHSIYTTYTPTQIEFFGSQAVQYTFFLLPAFFYTLLDLLFPAFSARHKIQGAKRQPTGREIVKAAKGSLGNMGIVTALLAGKFWWEQQGGGGGRTMFRIEEELPTVREVLGGFMFAAAVREVTFYYLHRAFHHPRLYPHIHKLHHTFPVPTAFAAEYCTLTEHAFANVLPVILGHIILHSHIVSAWVYIAHEVFHAVADHSGYDFFKLPHPTKWHDAHHERFRVSYGVYGVLDWVHGTHKVRDKKKKAL